MSSQDLPPLMGYGTWNRNAQETYDGVTAALEIGYRHIDCAQSYYNEQDVGRAIAASGLRDEIFLTTKVDPEQYAKGKLLPSVEISLEKLQTAQVDLLLLHWPSPHDQVPLEVYVEQLAQVFDHGLCKYIGVSNFTIPLIDKAIRLLGERALLNNQIEIHPFLQNRPIVEHCQALGITTTAYCPIARGEVIGNAVLKAIAKQHNASEVQISLAFLMAEGHAVIPAARSRTRIQENFNALKIQLSGEEMQKIRALDKGMRLVDGAWCPKWDV